MVLLTYLLISWTNLLKQYLKMIGNIFET